MSHTVTTTIYSQTELAEMHAKHIDMFYGNVEGDALVAYAEFAQAMVESGYNPMTYREDGRFERLS